MSTCTVKIGRPRDRRTGDDAVKTWHIECWNGYEFARVNTARVHTMCGEPIPQTFKTRRAAEDWARDYGYAGRRNSNVRYTQEPTP